MCETTTRIIMTPSGGVDSVAWLTAWLKKEDWPVEETGLWTANIFNGKGKLLYQDSGPGSGLGLPSPLVAKLRELEAIVEDEDNSWMIHFFYDDEDEDLVISGTLELREDWKGDRFHGELEWEEYDDSDSDSDSDDESDDDESDDEDEPEVSISSKL